MDKENLQTIAQEIFGLLKQKGLTWKEARSVICRTNDLVNKFAPIEELRKKIDCFPLE